MEITEYRNFLSSLSEQQLKDYLYTIELGDLTTEERAELEHFLAKMKVEKVAQYLTLFGFLTIVLSEKPKFAKLASALGITKPEIKAPGEPPFDLVYTISSGACPECVAEAGKIYGKTTDKIPPLHPHCVCKFVKVYKSEMPKVKAMNLKWAPGGAVRAMKGADDQMVLEVLAAPFGGPNRKDRLGQYLSARTDFMIDIGGRRPTLYLHGYSPKRRAMEKPPVLGVAEVIRIDNQGLWMRTELDNSELSRRTWEAAKRGEARASTGSIAHLERHSKVTGEVTCWPIAELSVFDGGDKRVPVSDDAVVIPLRALFDDLELEYDERFEAGEDADLLLDESSDINEMEVDMPTAEELQAAVAGALKAERDTEAAALKSREEQKKSIIDELKVDPQYRGIFNVNEITDRNLTITDAEAKRGVTKESKEENNAFLWHLMHPTQAPPAMRVLEESEALEGGPMVPTDMLNQIVEIKGPMSLVDKIGLHRYKTNSLVFNFPTETAAMTALAAIAEEDVYVANEPAFATVAATVIKYGSMVTVTDEMLEDQNLFQPYFVKAVAKAWALAENLTLYTELDVLATSTQGQHSATFTDTEIMAWFFSVLDEWADGGHIIMNRATMGTMRALLIGTPRAYGAFPDFGGGDIPSFMGTPVHTNGNWLLAGSGDENLVLTYVHPDAVGWVENGELSIKVDPYGDALNGRVRYFPRCRFETEVLQALGNVTYTDHA